MSKLSKDLLPRFFFGIVLIMFVIALCWNFLELKKTRAEIRIHKGRANALQTVLEAEGFEVKWHPKSNSIEFRKGDEFWGGIKLNLDERLDQTKEYVPIPKEIG